LEYKKDRETFLVAYVDAKMHILDCEEAQGGISQSVIYPRDIVKRALELDCVGIVISHNHPSGDPTPSPEDISVTRKLVAIFDTLGAKVFDHIIIGSERFYSLAEYNYLESMRTLPKPDDMLPIVINKVFDWDIENEEEL
jgi:DNA repair protein RadC